MAPQSRRRLEALKQRIEGQNTLIEALRGDAEQVSKLRAEVRSRISSSSALAPSSRARKNS